MIVVVKARNIKANVYRDGMVELSILEGSSCNENLGDKTKILRNRHIKHKSLDRHIWRKQENRTCLAKIWFPPVFEGNANDSKYLWNLLLVISLVSVGLESMFLVFNQLKWQSVRHFWLWYQSTQFIVMILISLLIKKGVTHQKFMFRDH